MIAFMNENLRFLSEELNLSVQAAQCWPSHRDHRMTQEYLGRLSVMVIWISGGIPRLTSAHMAGPLVMELTRISWRASFGCIFKVLYTSILNFNGFI